MNIQNLSPPILQDIYFRYLKKQIFRGKYTTFDEASRYCESYNSQVIFDKVREATAQVRDGKAVYERDSVLFEHIEYDYFVLSSLLQAAAENAGNLRVLDFGGALGSTYFQNRKYLNRLTNLSWNIVEQQQFVDIGKMEFTSSTLHFYDTMQNCISEQQPNLALISNALQYLKNPQQIFQELSNSNIQYFIVTMLPLSGYPNFFTVQHVPKKIYEASYVMQVFNEDFIESELLKSFEIIESHLYQQKISVNHKWINYKGYFLKRK